MRIGDFRKKLSKESRDYAPNGEKGLAFRMALYLEEARLCKGLTQTELAKKAGTKQSNIARVESGSSLPSLSFLSRIAGALGTHLILPKFTFMEATRGVTAKVEAGLSKNVTEIVPEKNLPLGYFQPNSRAFFGVDSKTY